MLLIISKVTDNLLMARQAESIQWVSEQIQHHFGLIKSIIDDTVDCNGCRIGQVIERNITISMESYVTHISLIDTTRA